VFLAVGALASILALNYAVRNEAGILILWLGLLSVTMIFSSSLCLSFALAKFLEARRARSKPVEPPISVNVDREYIAQYSLGDRVTAIAIAAFFGALTIFFLLRSNRLRATGLSLLFFFWALFYVVHITITRIRFTHEGFVARLPWFREISEPYARVQRISGKPGTLKIEFSDGRTLKIHSGLGDAHTVVAYLQAHCPESVLLE